MDAQHLRSESSAEVLDAWASLTTTGLQLDQYHLSGTAGLILGLMNYRLRVYDLTLF